MEKRFVFALIISISLLLIVLTIFKFGNFNKEILTCGDGSLYEQCSLNKPYFCSEGILIERASVCGCPDILIKNQDSCISKYQGDTKNISLKYILRGEKKEIDFIIYDEMYNYLEDLPRYISYNRNEQPSRQDFKFKKINNEEQRELLLPLVTKIQNIAKDKNDQMRIALSVVQNIPFGSSEKIAKIGFNQETNYSRYPYEVVYEMQGVCGEKSELLAFLLKEIGYSTAIFYYQLENHEALGIKCPLEYSLLETGYCFVETSGPSILSNNELEYVGSVRLNSEPELIFISEGNSLDEKLYEYKDAKSLIRINKDSKIGFFESFRFNKLNEKYGLEEKYNIG